MDPPSPVRWVQDLSGLLEWLERVADSGPPRAGEPPEPRAEARDAAARETVPSAARAARRRGGERER